MFGNFTDWGRVRSVCYKWISWGFIIISNSNIITTLAAKKCCSPVEQTPGVSWKEGNALEFINLGKSALIDEEEWDDPSLYGFPIFRANRWGVPIGGAQVQFIPANTAAVADMSLRSRGRREGMMGIPVEVSSLANLRFFHFCFLINGCDRDRDSNNDTIGELMMIKDSLACNWVCKEILPESGDLNWPSSRQEIASGERSERVFAEKKKKKKLGEESKQWKGYWIGVS